MPYIPRYYQEDAVEAIFMYYAKGNTGNPVVAMPTASGKSLVIAEFVKKVLTRWPRQRIICLTHVKELIQQNAEKLREQWPEVPLGIYSAGLGQRDLAHPIIYGGIASVIACVEKFGWRDLMIVDEAHLISPKDTTEYQMVIKLLKQTNPNLKIIGLTATPYRMGQGLITDGGIFTDICYDLCSMESFNKLIAEGYLVAPVPKRMKTYLDTSKVSVQQGEFNSKELQDAVDKDPITYAACKEIVEEGFDRKSWLIFASGVKHADHIAAMLQSLGVDARAVHSKMPPERANNIIKDFRINRFKAIVNYGKLTTGFDHPAIDLIGMLRPTMSTGLWVQMLGRGTRPSIDTHKENCLVLDFARNTPRLGPINDPVIPRKRVKGAVPGVAPIRICDKCGVYNHARAVVCIACGAPFPIKQKLDPNSGMDALIRQDKAVIESFDVVNTVYNLHQKKESKPIMKVSYFCGLRMFSEYVCFEHEGYAKKKAWQWWINHMGTPTAPPTTAAALEHVAKLRRPKRITVSLNRRYPEVLSCEY